MYNTFEEVARRYAKALFEIAQENTTLDTMAEEINTLGNMFSTSDELRHLVRTPGITPQQFAEVFTALLGKMQASDLLKRFIQLLCSRKRPFLIPSIIRHFSDMRKAARGEVSATLTSAQPLSKAQLNAFGKALQPLVGQGTILLTHRIDEKLIGGITILLGARLIDLSVRHRLDAIHHTLSEV